MNRKAWLILFSTIIWFVASSTWYLCVIKKQCPEKLETMFSSIHQPVESVFATNDGPISFHWDQAEPIFNQGYDSIMVELMSRMGPRDTLSIIGEYFKGESGPEIGLQRATEVQKSANLYLDNSRIKSESSLNEYGNPGKLDLFNAVRFQIISEVIISDMVEVQSQQNPYQVTIWFRDRTAYKILTPEAEQAIQTLVDALRNNSDYRIDVVGHTDLNGTVEENYLLGRQRAWSIKKMLWDKGLEPTLIHTESKGGLSPLSSSSEMAVSSSDQRVEVVATISN
jgi:OmpA family